MRLLLLIPIVIIVFFDYISKIYVKRILSENSYYILSDYIYLEKFYNKGIAFSLFDDGGDLGRWILVTLDSFVCLYLVYLLLYESLKKYESLALLLILSGGIGNLIDRSFRGYVIDFINFYYESHSFYIFNFADSFITIGVIIYIVDIVLSKLRLNGNKTS